jgi:hypothetical protein
MTVELNHTIVCAQDNHASAAFIAQVLDLPPLVDDAAFDAAYARLLDAGVPTYADPFFRQPGEINDDRGGRGVYFPDPVGHTMELLTKAE